MDATIQPFDLSRFAKLWALADTIPDGPDNSRERATARRMAETMVSRAGMTLDAAISALKRSTTPKRPDLRMPDSFRWHRMERALHRAGADMISDAIPLDAESLRTIREAVPMPKNIRAALAELDIWIEIEEARLADAPTYFTGGTLRARFDMVALYAARARASCLSEAVARAQWWAGRIALGEPVTSFDRVAAASIADDMQRMAERVTVLTRDADERPSQPKPAPLRRTGAMKRADVLSILDEPGGDRLTLRMVAERAGVSPETVRRVKRDRTTPSTG